MNHSEKMMFEGDHREEFMACMEEMKGIFIQPNSGAPMIIEEEVNVLEEIDFI